MYELNTTPTGEYDVDNNVNIGRNYWSFDRVFAVTNLNMKTGRDFSLVAGYMINTENDARDYKTGHDLHATNRLEADYAVVTLAWQFIASDN